MIDFMLETFEPSVFWNALSAIGALAAVLTALFLPSLSDFQKARRIKRLLQTELAECIKEVISSEKLEGIPAEAKAAVRVKFLSRINTDVWEAHKHFLLASNPDKYLPYRKIYKQITHIINLASTPSPEALMVLDYDVKDLKKQYAELCKSEKCNSNA